MIRTTNGMLAHESTGNVILDIFASVGATKDLFNLPQEFRKALGQNVDLATRLMLHVRDIRKGMGRRDPFWEMFAVAPVFVQTKVLAKLPELGYWKDIRKVIENSSEFSFEVRNAAVELLKNALVNGDGLAAKYTPRSGIVFNILRSKMAMTPKALRKFLVESTKVVEQQMCSKDWEGINYSHVPSKAMTQYRNAFRKHDAERFEEFNIKAASGEAKVNTGALYIHQIAKLAKEGDSLAQGMWNQFEQYTLGNILPIVDASGSMTWFDTDGVDGRTIAASLGLYFAQNAQGDFKDHLITFSDTPTWVVTNPSDSLRNNLNTIENASWTGSTNLMAVFKLILEHARKYNAPQEAMPETLLIFSDMQFNQAISFDWTLMESIKVEYSHYGYKVPKIVYWDVEGGHGTFHATKDTKDVAMLSGFSVQSAKALISGADFTPLGVMLATLMDSRYDWQAKELN